MSNISTEDTDIEIAVRKRLWHDGFRYRTNVDDVPGKPDICHKGRKVAVFIDGCFWHGCPKCNENPDTNSQFWRKKFQENKERREEVRRKLKDENWTILEFWEHEVKEDIDRVVEEIEDCIGE